MAIPRRSRGSNESPIQAIFNKIQTVVSSRVNSLPSKDQAKGIAVSVESFSASNIDGAALGDSYDSVRTDLTDVAKDAYGISDNLEKVNNDGGFEGGDEAAIAAMKTHQAEVSAEAGTVMMMAYNGVGGYYTNYGKTPSMEGARVNKQAFAGPAGNIPVVDGRSLPSMESFDEKETEKWREHSYGINMLAAKQHEFIELFYRSYIATPDEAGFLMTIRRNVVWNGFRQTDLSGDQVDMAKKNVLEALLDHTVLESESTDAIPCIHDGDNDKYFVDPAVFIPEEVTQAGETFETNFLKFNEGFNLVGLCQTPSRMQKGVPNDTDSLDSRIALGTLALTIGGEPCHLSVNRSQYAQFLAVREGNFREMFIKFHTETLPLNSELRSTAPATLGKVPKALQDMLDLGYTAQFAVKIDGEMNVESSNGELRIAGVKVSKVFKDGKEISLNDATVKPLITALALTCAGFKLEARLTNINQLEIGLLVDSDVMKEGFIIPTLAPLTIKKPAQTDDEKVFPRMEALTTAYRIQMRNAGLTTLLNRRAELKSFLGNDNPHPIESCMGLEGVGQYYMRPYYVEVEIDLLAELNNLTSAGKMGDIQGLIVGKINELAYRADMLTGYSAALEAAFPGSTPKPHLAIGTDKRLPQYIMVPGDDRTVAIGMNHTVASISDLRMKNQIIMSFVLPNEKDPHPLQHGVMAMIPEYLVNFQMIRDQRIANEIRLTPRYRHFNFLPLMMSITIKNLEEAVAMRTAIDMNSKTVDAFPSEVSQGMADAVVADPKP